MGELFAGRLSGRVWSVGALVGAVASLLEQELPACSVGGEISGFSRAASGHCYFTLKDPGGGAALRCAIFRRAAALLDFAPVEGQRVELRGRLAVYEPRGELQFIAEAMQSAGAGALYERFLRLRARLEAEGFFDPALKRPLPPHPRAIGVVTSLAGAVLHDVATTLARRSPHVQVVIYPSVVQGIDAPAALCQAIALAGRRGEVDILVVCRGGGSLEDLWAFNDERVVRAIRAAPMHVVSGVGHETDVTLADLAADLRAPTPTAAAELVAPATAALRQGLDGLAAALARRGRAKRWGSAGTSSICLPSASPPRRHAPWPPADRVPTRPRLASVTRSRSRGRASPRGSTVRPFDSWRSTRSGCSPAATLCSSIATIGRSPRSRVWRSGRPSARVCPTAGPSSRRRRSSRRARPGDSVGGAGKEAPYNRRNEQQP